MLHPRGRDSRDIVRKSNYRDRIERFDLKPATPAPAPSDEAALGGALRRARKAHGFSLEQVAQETAISRSLLSLIETGRSDITIGRLSRLARLYDVKLSDLLPEPRNGDPIVVRSDDRRAIHYASEGIDVEILVPEGVHGIQALLATLAPLAAMRDYIQQPHEQFVHVLDGRIRTEFGDGSSIELGTGDSATFSSGELGHRHANLSREIARMLTVIRRPSPR